MRKSNLLDSGLKDLSVKIALRRISEVENNDLSQKTSVGINKESPIKVLKVIHGYPPYYMAGSEVYTATLCYELAKHVKLSIFTKIENEYQKPYDIKVDNEYGIKIIRVNKPRRDYTFRSKYLDERMANLFEEALLIEKPDIVHIGHLSHLTILIVKIIKKFDIPIIFTLHDFWMMCIRGQLIKDDLSLCSGPSIDNCTKCNMKYFTSEQNARADIEDYLTKFREVNELIDLFIAPSKFLRNVYLNYGIPENKIIFMDYGFDTSLFANIKNESSEKIRFGFIGRIIPVKGVATLIEAFNQINHNKALLNIYGNCSNSYLYLKEQCKNTAIQFHGAFNYQDIAQVLSNIDALIVPSLWYENSPLVIHEAFLANIPVITSNLGGMAELVKHGQNGLLFEPGNAKDLKDKIESFILNPALIKALTRNPTKVRSIQQDAQEIIELYDKLIKTYRDER